jgi:hypothetical protein
VGGAAPNTAENKNATHANIDNNETIIEINLVMLLVIGLGLAWKFLSLQIHFRDKRKEDD